MIAALASVLERSVGNYCIVQLVVVGRGSIDIVLSSLDIVRINQDQ